MPLVRVTRSPLDRQLADMRRVRFGLFAPPARGLFASPPRAGAIGAINRPPARAPGRALDQVMVPPPIPLERLLPSLPTASPTRPAAPPTAPPAAPTIEATPLIDAVERSPRRRPVTLLAGAGAV